MKEICLVSTSVAALVISGCSTTAPQPFSTLTEEDFVSFQEVVEDVRCSVGLYLSSRQAFEIKRPEIVSELSENLSSTAAFISNDEISITEPEATFSLRKSLYALTEQVEGSEEKIAKMQVSFQLTGSNTTSSSSQVGLSVPIGNVALGGNVSASGQTNVATVASFTSNVDLTELPDGQSIDEFCKVVRDITEEEPAPTAENDELAKNLLAWESAVFADGHAGGPVLTPESLQLTGSFQVKETDTGGISLSFLVFSFGGTTTQSNSITQKVTVKSNISRSQLKEATEIGLTGFMQN